ncbi:MAG: BglG family transcription antiterminator [Anaerorhabdus sp.]
MQKRQEKIIRFLEDSKSWMTGKELSALLNVTDRTIRADINSINSEFPDLVKSNVRHGYRINAKSFVENNISIDRMIPQTPQERCIYILHELLFNRNEINLTFLQEEVYVSGYSIDNDIKKIKKILKPYASLKIERKKNYISLIGTEEDKRSLYKSLLSNETKGNFINLNNIAQLYHNIDLLEIKDIIEDILSQYDFKIREDAFPMLMIHIGVAIERMKRSHYISTDYKTAQLQNSKEYLIASKFFDELASKYQILINEDEVALIALLLLGKKSVNYTQDIIKNNTNVDIDVLMNKIFDNIKEDFDINFSKDKTFKLGLQIHLQNLLERIKKNIPLTNIYLTEIKRKYPLVFEMAVYVGHTIEKESKLKINEDEIGYLALHLGAAYDRLNLSNKHEVLLIQPNNQVLGSMLLKKIEDRFKEYMEVVDVMNYFEASAVEEYNPDLIISTVQIKHQLNIPTITISLFMNSEDEFNIFKALHELDIKRSKKYFTQNIQELISEDFFFLNLDLKTPTEVIEYMCDKMREKGVVDSKFKESVIEREKIAATSFNHGFACPHPLLASANKTTIAIATLKNEISWGEYEVRLIILLAINDDSRKLLGVIFDWLSNLTKNSSTLINLLDTKNIEEFTKSILE